MALIEIDGGYFDGDGRHDYYDAGKSWIPSCTQILKLQGLTSYEGIAPEVLEEASRRGTEVHELTDAYDRFDGDIDPAWITPTAEPYFNAYRRFLKETGFVSDKAWIERSMVTKIYGMALGIKPDRRGRIDGTDCVLEIKCTASEQKSWAFQTASQEMAILNTQRCGAMRRHALWLRKNGTYRLIPYTNHHYDASQFIAALSNVYARLDAGQKLWEKF